MVRQADDGAGATIVLIRTVAQNGSGVTDAGAMRMRKVLIAIAVLIVLVWLIPWDPQPEGEIQVPPPVSPVVTTPESRSTIRANDARAIVAPESVPEVAEPSAPSPQAPATTTAMALRMWDERGTARPQFQQRENAFVAEPVDPLWSRSREAEILGQLAQINGLRLISIEVECRTSTCRLQWTQKPVFVEGEVKGLPTEVYEDLLARLGYTEDVAMGTAFVGEKGEGGITSLMYLPRQPRRFGR